MSVDANGAIFGHMQFVPSGINTPAWQKLTATWQI
jgi:hypothetical protein